MHSPASGGCLSSTSNAQPIEVSVTIALSKGQAAALLTNAQTYYEDPAYDLQQAVRKAVNRQSAFLQRQITQGRTISDARWNHQYTKGAST